VRDVEFNARLSELTSGRYVEVWSTEPGLQLYTAGQFDGALVGHGDVRYTRFSGVALETQHFPDSPNKPTFPTVTLEPGQLYRSATEYRFHAQ